MNKGSSLMKLLCVGCGACIAICPATAISPAISKGYFSITINENRCISCHLCVRNCPIMHQLLRTHISKPSTLYARRVFLAWALDEKIRYRGASGGVLTALLKYLLDKRLIDGALVVRMRGTYPEAFIAKDGNDVLKAQGSIYFPTYSLKVIKQIIKAHGRYAIVGLPCQISFINVLFKKRVVNRDKIAFLFGLKCHSIFASWYIEYLLSLLKLKREEIIAFSSRGFGWPGKVVILSKRGIFKIPLMNGNLSLWNPLASTNLAAQLGCILCSNHDGFGADIVFGDAWSLKPIISDRKGVSLVEVLTEEGFNVINEAATEKVIELQEIAFDELMQIPSSEENLAQEAIRMYIKNGIYDVLKTYGARGIMYVLVHLLFYNSSSRSLILKLPYKVLITLIEKGRSLSKAF